MFGFPLSVVFARRHNPFLENLIERYRNAVPGGFIDARAGPRALMAELAAGRSVGMHMDHRFDTGEMVPFFGIEAPTVTIPARLALKLNVPLIPCQIERLEGARFRLTLHAPIHPDPLIADAREAARRMTLEVNRRFEEWIRQRPEQWVCARRRWPKEVLRRQSAERQPAFPSTPQAA